MEKKKTILLSAAVVMVAVGGFWMLGSSEAKSTVSFATENVKKSNISNSITATGTIEPVTEVEVGTQVSGIIDKIYVAAGDRVNTGDLLLLFLLFFLFKQKADEELLIAIGLLLIL